MLISCQIPSFTESSRLFLPRSNSHLIAITRRKGGGRRSYLSFTSSHCSQISDSSFAMEFKEKPTERREETRSSHSFNLLFVEMGVGYDQHGFSLYTHSLSKHLM